MRAVACLALCSALLSWWGCGEDTEHASSAGGSSGNAGSTGASRNAGSAGATSAGGPGDGGAGSGSAGAAGGRGGSVSGNAGKAGAMSAPAGASSTSERCPNPSEEFPGSGTVKCDNGLVHRTSPAECAPFEPSDTALPPSMQPDSDECLTDADCTGGLDGDCQPPDTTYFKLHLWNFCVYGCTTDDDCEAGSVCDCSTSGGHCREANCTTDDDCAGDGYCARFPPGCGFSGFACQTADDECAVRTDCAQGLDCTSNKGGPWSCQLAGCPG